MTSTEKRLAEIFSYYIDERYADDLSTDFAEWLATSNYTDEVYDLLADLLRLCVRSINVEASG